MTKKQPQKFKDYTQSYFNESGQLSQQKRNEMVLTYTPLIKYIAARRALHMPAFNEPIDAVIYLITAGLGFAALENALFLVGSFLDGGLINGFVVGNMRFLGATLLHSVTSAVVGIAIAFSYFRKQEIKVINTFLGIILATLLHAIFNFYIIRTGGGELLNIFLVLWVFVLIIILLFERVKRIKK